jgi:hypothetical protein
MPACLCCDAPIAPKNQTGYCSRTPECRSRGQKVYQVTLRKTYRQRNSSAFENLLQEVRDRENAIKQAKRTKKLAEENARAVFLAAVREIERAGYCPTPGPPDRWFN